MSRGARKVKSLNARQERFCQLFVTLGIAAEAYRQAGYSTHPRALSVVPSQLLGFPRIKERIAQIQAKVSAKTEITKERLVEKFWEIVNDPQSKRGESVAAGIALAKMVGWNAPTRVEHDLGARVRSYLEDIRARPLRPVMIRRYDSAIEDKPSEGEVVDAQRVEPSE